MTTVTNTKTLEEIAEGIAKWQYGVGADERLAPYQQVLANKIHTALRDERQRAINIARGEDCGLADCLCATRIAVMIREGR